MFRAKPPTPEEVETRAAIANLWHAIARVRASRNDYSGMAAATETANLYWPAAETGREAAPQYRR